MTWSLRRRDIITDINAPHIHPVLARVYGARGLSQGDVDLEVARLCPASELKGIDQAADILAKAITDGAHITIVGDYDCDGATGTSVGVLGLRSLGAAKVSFIIPDRITQGYGLSPPLVDQALDIGASVLLTVDNGISAFAGVEEARKRGLTVVVTDHHLPGEGAPDAHAIVNPNQNGCGFRSKAMAGVGVMFSTLLAVQKKLGRQAQLSRLLDLVAIGTVADLVPLDYNNRLLVRMGMDLIRTGRSRPGVQALMEVAKIDPRFLTAEDIGFQIGPRLNSAGRLSDMTRGIRCLITDSQTEARAIADELQALNQERKKRQKNMTQEALDDHFQTDAAGLVAFRENWHEGIVGLVASQLKERHYKPSIAFAPADGGAMLKGSARSIAGFHIRDALVKIDQQYPGLMGAFGGHAMAAGMSIEADKLALFSQAFIGLCETDIAAEYRDRVYLSDGELAPSEIDMETALAIEAGGPWGQAFEAPLFEGTFKIQDVSTMGEDHSHARYKLEGGLTAVHFGGAEEAPISGEVSFLYRLTPNRWNDRVYLQMRVETLI